MLQKLNPAFFIAIDKNQKLILNEGETIDVRILAKSSDGTARIGIRNFSFTAKAPANIQVGQNLKMLVSFKENKLMLSPILPEINDSSESLSKQLADFADKSLRNYIITEFSQLNIPLNLTKIAEMYQLVENTFYEFTSKKNLNKSEKELLKKDLSFLALALKEKGILVSEELLKKVYSTFFGNGSKEEKSKNSNEQSSYKTKRKNEQKAENKTQEFFPENLSLPKKNIDTNEQNDELITLFTHLKGKANMHWLLFPFSKKNTKKQAITGNIAFLLNLKNNHCVKTIIRAKLNTINFIFEISGNTCRLAFENDTKFNKNEKKVILNFLQSEMKAKKLNVDCTFSKKEAELRPLNLEA